MTAKPRHSYWVLNVDLSGSTSESLSDSTKQRVYAVLENCFRFFANNEDLTDADYAWAGDGGFALLSETKGYTADTALKIAEWFARYAGHFVDSAYLGEPGINPPTLRIVVGHVLAVEAERISNVAGRMLNVFLKYERSFGNPSHISILEDVYSQLKSDSKKRFSPRDKLVDVAGQQHRVYDLPIHAGGQEGMRLTTLILTSKNDIDHKTVRWLAKKIFTERTKDIGRVVEDAFTPGDLFPEIVGHVHLALSGAFPGHAFRVAYVREKGAFLVGDYCALPGTEAFQTPIPLAGRFTACLAHREGQPILVASTREELKLPEEKRRFNLLHARQSVDKLASVACIPIVILDDDNQVVYRPGVLSIDTPTDGFFSASRMQLVAALEPLVMEISIAALFDRMLATSSSKGVQRPAPKARRQTARKGN